MKNVLSPISVTKIIAAEWRQAAAKSPVTDSHNAVVSGNEETENDISYLGPFFEVLELLWCKVAAQEAPPSKAKIKDAMTIEKKEVQSGRVKPGQILTSRDIATSNAAKVPAMSSPDVGAVVLSSYICLFLAYLALSFFPDWPLLSLPPAAAWIAKLFSGERLFQVSFSSWSTFTSLSPALHAEWKEWQEFSRSDLFSLAANTGDCSTLRRARCLGLMLDDCRNCSLSSEAQVKQQETGCSTLSPLATAVSRGHLEVVVELLQWPTLRINEILQVQVPLQLLVPSSLSPPVPLSGRKYCAALSRVERIGGKPTSRSTTRFT
eukprot:scaffold50_cov162-Ochromonas_danica.AAC.24